MPSQRWSAGVDGRQYSCLKLYRGLSLDVPVNKSSELEAVMSPRPPGYWDDFLSNTCPDPCPDPCCDVHGCGGRREICPCRDNQPEWKEEAPWHWTRD
jgi:hypothetical protein